MVGVFRPSGPLLLLHTLIRCRKSDSSSYSFVSSYTTAAAAASWRLRNVSYMDAGMVKPLGCCGLSRRQLSVCHPQVITYFINAVDIVEPNVSVECIRPFESWPRIFDLVTPDDSIN